MKSCLHLLLALVLLVSCNKHVSEVSIFAEIESLMEEHPDSALKALESMPVPSKSNKSDYATYCLLLTQAQDKNYMKPASDSVIMEALPYFLAQKDDEKKATALYYAGRVNRELNRHGEAARFYLDAAQIVDSLNILKLQSLVYSNLGYIYLFESLYENALPVFHKANIYATQLNDSLSMPYTLRDLGRTYEKLGKTDSAKYYLNKGVQITKETNDEEALCVILNEIYFIYKKEKDYKSAIESLLEAKEIRERNHYRDNSKVYRNLGEAYFLVNQFDSAQYFLEKALLTEDIYTIASASKLLYRMYVEQGVYQQAFKYNDLFNTYNDSIRVITRSKDIAEIQAKYDQEKLKNENNQLVIQKNKLQIGFLISGLIVFIVIALIIFKYQKKLLLKERYLQKVKEQIRINTITVKENEATIRKNEETIRIISKQLKNNDDLKEQLTEQIEEIDKINKENQILINQNLSLKNEIRNSSSISNIKVDTETHEKTIERNSYLQERNTFLTNLLLENMDVFTEIKQKDLKRIDDGLWHRIISAIDLVYDNYTKRLHDTYPSLSLDELQFCCLVKLKFSTSELAKVYYIAPSSITKRKQRIKDKIGIDKNISFDTYLWNF